MIIGIELLRKLDPSNVFVCCQFPTLRLMFNEFGLSFVNYNTSNAGLPLCEKGEYDTIEHLLLHFQRIKMCALKNKLIEKEKPFYC